MDAKITKERLGNLLSYDWLKLLLAIAMATLAFVVFFTTVRTRPRNDQEYHVYAYTDLTSGEDSYLLGDTLEERGVFSYDVLVANAEIFDNGLYADAAFTARRSAGEGNVMFLTHLPAEDTRSTLESLIDSYAVYYEAEDREVFEMLFDVNEYFEYADAYLTRFFGADWRTGGTLDEARVREAFLARNGTDKRYKTDASKDAGVESEKERLRSLRDDLLFVEGKFADGTFTVTEVTSQHGAVYAAGIGLGKLARLSSLYYHAVEVDGVSQRSVDGLNLVLFNNGQFYDGDNRKIPTEKIASGEPVGSGIDLAFETVSFLRWIAETYA